MTKLSRRQALMRAGQGLGAVALAGMLELDGVLIRTSTGSKASGRANEYRYRYDASNRTAG